MNGVGKVGKYSHSHAFRKFFQNRLAFLGAVICLLFLFCALFAPLLSTHDPNEVNVRQMLKPPSLEHFLGTDELGRDYFSRLMHGSRITFVVGIVAVLIALFFGTTLGLVSGYFGGRLDALITAMLDTIWAFPTLILALAIVAALGASLQNILLAIGIVYIPGFARIVRSMVLSVKEAEYVKSARTIGRSHFSIIRKHILPNVISVVIVQTSLNAAQAIITEATLSFMGLGIQPPQASGGSTLKTSFSFLYKAPWLCVYPGLAILLVVLGLNFIGDGLRDALDVRIRAD
jgi:peptide/nickel transport system permease protein